MQRQKRLYFSLIFMIIIAMICNIFFCSNFIIRADEEEYAPDDSQQEEIVPPPTPWDGLTYERFDLDGNGTGTKEDPYIIDTAGKLAYLAQKVNAEFQPSVYSGVYFKQTADIDLGATFNKTANLYEKVGGVEWKSIGYYSSSADRSFRGNFDGDGFRIYNVGFNESGKYDKSYGLFGYTKDATITNVNVSINIEINSGGNGVGGLIGNASNTIINNSFVNVNISGNVSNVAGLVGVYDTNNGTALISNTASGDIESSNTSTNIAGVVAIVNGETNISDCISEVNIEANTTGIGGICSVLGGQVNIINCTNRGYIAAENCNKIGGITPTAIYKIQSCNNYGRIISTGSEIGGIVGANIGNIINCTNYATINGKDKIGGIAGTSKSIIRDCSNKGAVTGNDYVAGIVGEVQANGTEYIFEKNFNTAKITGHNYVAGVVAKLSGVNMELCFSVGATLRNEDNTYDIIGNDYVSGLVSIVLDADINNCISTSNVSSANIGAGLVAKYNGPAAKNSFNNFYYVGSVQGVKIAGIVQDAGFVNLKDGYSVVKLLAIYENTPLDLNNSGAVVGLSTDSSYNKVLYNSDTCNTSSGTAVSGLIAQTTDELIYGTSELLNTNVFYILPEEPVGDEYYYDYYPILRDLHFNIYNSEYDNYFLNSSEVSNVVKKMCIARTFKTVRIKFYTNCDIKAEDVFCRQNVDITDLVPGISKEGYVFRGWYLDPDFAVKLDLTQGLSSSATLYAKFEYPEVPFPWWIFIIVICVAIMALVGVVLYVYRKKTISFRIGDMAMPDIKIRVGTYIKLPKPKKAGHRFKGWYYNEELTKKFDLEIMPNIDLILFGEFKEIKRRVKVEAVEDKKPIKKSKSTTKKSVKVLKETVSNNPNADALQDAEYNEIKEESIVSDTVITEDQKEQ